MRFECLTGERFWPVCLAVCLPDCSLTGLSPTADGHHNWSAPCSNMVASCSLPASLGSTRVEKKTKWKKNPGIFLLKKFSPLQGVLPAFPIIKSSYLFVIPCRQKPGITEGHAVTTRVIHENKMYMCENKPVSESTQKQRFREECRKCRVTND